jgi:hypothetical protein
LAIEPTPLQIEQQTAPVVRAFPRPIGEADQFLPAFRRRADQHENALLFVFEPRLEMDAVGPDVDITLRREVALLPLGVIVLPSLLQAADRRRRKPGGILAEQRRQRVGKIAGRDALEI